MVEYYILGRTSVWDALRGKFCTSTFTGATDVGGPYGVSKQVASGSSNKVRIDGVAAAPTGNYTVLVVGKCSSAGWSSFAGVYTLADSSNNAIFSLQESGGGGQFQIYHGANNTGNLGSVTTYFPSSRYVTVGNDFNGTSAALYSNGYFIAGSSQIPLSGTADHWNVGNERTAGAARPGDYTILVRWNRLLTSSEHLAFSQNPWYPLQTKVQSLFSFTPTVGGGGGGKPTHYYAQQFNQG